ncbi:hypothetical protein C9381_11800 [Pantoea vagans]|uniref:Uncharacterized protein n=1 Tax=Pantoea vagans TaxID=470934 RepID=A0AAN1TVU9_9GAMM|nr:hypothetical protein C9381_11800 [Pantoea vagans]
MILWLADRWGEPDPSVIAALPCDTLNHWRAYFLQQGILTRSEPQSAQSPHDTRPNTATHSVDQQCDAVMRALM